MRLKTTPFNVRLMMPDRKMLSFSRRVSVLDTYDSSGTSFHPEGLFSIETFGRLGTNDRDTTFAYIDLNTAIIHPELFMTLKRLKSLYAGIISGKRFAVWSEEEKDFFPSDAESGSTGMHFFCSKFAEIVFKKNKSDIRSERIELIKKYITKPYLTKHLVLPAGVRDLHINDMGNPEEDEVNDLYRKLIMTASTIAATEQNLNSPNLDSARWAMQLTAQKIHLMIKNIISGKKGWFLYKHGRRATRHGTANVITAMNANAYLMGAPGTVSITDTQMGLLQALKGSGTIATYEVTNGFLREVIGDGEQDVWLVNKKTLNRELVQLSPDAVDLYTTRPGIEKLINMFFVRELRNRPLIIDGYYIGLLYNDGKSYKLFRDIDDLPEGSDKKYVTPITLAELIYASVHQRFKKLVGTVTRFPVTGSGSCYPTNIKVRTTSKTSCLSELGDDWTPKPKEFDALSWPAGGDNDWLDSLVPNITRLGGLGADFDGDRCASPIFFSKNAYDEVQNYFKLKSSFIAPDGKLYQSAANVDTIKLVVSNMTGDPIEFGD